MRNISPAALAILRKQTGIEPICIVQVYWNGNSSQPINYCDRAFAQDGLNGGLLELSNIEDVVDISKAANTAAITVTLDDTSGQIKAIFDTHDIILTTVYVYQWFPNLPLSEAFIIFEGQIATPIAWKEGTRQLTFDVLSKVEDLQYGFSADQGDFEYIPPEIVDKAWPLPFGTIAMVPSLKLFNTNQGLLAQNTIGRANINAARVNNLWDSYYKAFNSMFECLTKALFCLQQATNLEGDGAPSSPGFILPPILSQGLNNPAPKNAADNWILKGNQYQDQYLKYQAQCQKILSEIMNLESHKNTTIEVQGNFPQGVETTLQIGDSTYTGMFSGNIFTVISDSNPFAGDGTLLAGPLTLTDGDVAEQYAAQTNEQNFFFNVAGSSVLNSTEMVYIVSLFEVQVLGVYANFNGVRTAVPSQYYTVNYVDFGAGIQATYLTVNPSLPFIDKGWSDQVYCTITSPVGPNMVDIIQWIIGQYTHFGWDEASFDEVRNFVSQYPMNFALLKRGNVIRLLKDIAFQGRCAIYFKQGLFYLRFLADMTGYVDTIDEEDVEFATLEISATPTEELITKYTATYTITGTATVNAGQQWTDSVNPNNVVNPQAINTGEDSVIWFYNVPEYGLIEKTDSYFCYNIPELVERASMFWLVRYTNTWKRIKFSTFLSHLDLETFDYVLLNFSRPWVANGPVVGMVEQCLYDSANDRVELTIWIPVRFGSTGVYPFAAPYNIDPTLLFPEEYQTPTNTNQIAGGQLIPRGVTATPPAQRSGSQQINPSDNGFPTPEFETELVGELNAAANPNPSGASNQYKIKPVTNPAINDAPGVFPGIIRGQVDTNYYQVDVYFSGFIAGTAQPTSCKVYQMQINENDVIPPGTPVLVMRNLFVVSTDNATGLQQTQVEYIMQVPVWLQGDESEGEGESGNPVATGSPDGENQPGGPEPGTGDFSGDNGAGGDYGSPDSEGGGPSTEGDGESWFSGEESGGFGGPVDETGTGSPDPGFTGGDSLGGGGGGDFGGGGGDF